MNFAKNEAGRGKLAVAQTVPLPASTQNPVFLRSLAFLQMCLSGERVLWGGWSFAPVFWGGKGACQELFAVWMSEF